jgi:hypothetical protein
MVKPILHLGNRWAPETSPCWSRVSKWKVARFFFVVKSFLHLRNRWAPALILFCGEAFSSSREQVGTRYFSVMKLFLFNRWASGRGTSPWWSCLYGNRWAPDNCSWWSLFYISGTGGHQILLRVEYYITNGHQILLHLRKRWASDRRTFPLWICLYGNRWPPDNSPCWSLFYITCGHQILLHLRNRRAPDTFCSEAFSSSREQVGTRYVSMAKPILHLRNRWAPDTFPWWSLFFSSGTGGHQELRHQAVLSLSSTFLYLAADEICKKKVSN